MDIRNVNIKDLTMYENNPRNNDNAVDAVADSIKKFGFKVPMVIDKDNVIVCGHTRYKACLKLGVNEVPCVIADDLNDEQIKAFRIADNRTSEFADWDYDLLKQELEGIENIDMSVFDFDIEGAFENNLSQDGKEEKYTSKVDIPHYEIKGEKPNIEDLVKEDKTFELLEEIKKSNVTGEQKEFLIKAAYRHNTFDYSKIAEYYAHANEEMQNLMEKSALVIIDYDDAVKNGYVHLKEKIGEIYDENE